VVLKTVVLVRVVVGVVSEVSKSQERKSTPHRLVVDLDCDDDGSGYYLVSDCEGHHQWSGIYKRRMAIMIHVHS